MSGTPTQLQQLNNSASNQNSTASQHNKQQDKLGFVDNPVSRSLFALFVFFVRLTKLPSEQGQKRKNEMKFHFLCVCPKPRLSMAERKGDQSAFCCQTGTKEQGPRKKKDNFCVPQSKKNMPTISIALLKERPKKKTLSHRHTQIHITTATVH